MGDEVRQSEKAIKGLKAMRENLEKQIVECQEYLMSIDVCDMDGKETE